MAPYRLPKPPKPEPNTTPPKTTDGTSTGRQRDDASHLDDAAWPELDEGALDPDGPQPLGEDGELLDADLGPESIDREAFWLVFQTAFNLPGQLMHKLQPLAIQPEEKQPARAASDSVYALLEIYYPAALVPQSDTLAHVITAAPFIIGKVMVARAIFAGDRSEVVELEEPEGDENVSE